MYLYLFSIVSITHNLISWFKFIKLDGTEVGKARVKTLEKNVLE